MTFIPRWLVREAEDAPKRLRRGVFSRNSKGRPRARDDYHSEGRGDT